MCNAVKDLTMWLSLGQTLRMSDEYANRWRDPKVQEQTSRGNNALRRRQR